MLYINDAVVPSLEIMRAPLAVSWLEARCDCTITPMNA